MTTATPSPPLIPVPAAPVGHRYRRVTVEPVSGAGARSSAVSTSPATSTTTSSPRCVARSSTTTCCSSAGSSSAGAAGRVQPALRAVQPRPLHRTGDGSRRGDRGRAGGIGAAALHVREPVALRLLVPARTTVRVDPPRARGTAVRWRHDLGEPGGSRTTRSPKGMQTMLSSLQGVHSAVNAYSHEDAGAPRHVRRHDGAHE